MRAATVSKLCELLDLTPDDIPDHLPLVSLGMDSLSAVELANWASETFGTPAPSAADGGANAQRLAMLTTMTLAKLVQLTLEALPGAACSSTAAAAECAAPQQLSALVPAQVPQPVVAPMVPPLPAAARPAWP